MKSQNILNNLSELNELWSESIDAIKLIDSDYNTKVSEITNKVNDFKKWKNDIKQDRNILKICVAGDFNTGKSTFINGLIDNDLLGMKINPSTARVIALTYGPELKFFKLEKNNGKKKEITKIEFDKYSNKQDNKCDQDNIHHFEISIPCNLLKKIKLYDTPGFSTTEFKVDDKITEEQIAKSDFVIWVSIPDYGTIKESELKKITQIEIPLLYLVNMMDDISPQERNKVLENYKETIKKKGNNAEVFPYAAKPILDSRIQLIKFREAFDNRTNEIRNNIETKYDSGIQITPEDYTIKSEDLATMLPPNNEETYLQYRDSLINYINTCLLDKKYKRKIEEKSLLNRTSNYYDNLIKDLKKAKKRAEDKREEFKINEGKELDNNTDNYKELRKRITTSYQNLKITLQENFKLDIFQFIGMEGEKGSAIVNGKGDSFKLKDDAALSKFYSEIYKFADDLINEFKEVFSFKSDLSNWKESFHKAVKEALESTQNKFPDMLQIKKVTKKEVDTINKQLLDNILPDELFFHFLELYSEYLKAREDENIYNKYEDKIKKLEDFIKNAEPYISPLNSDTIK